MVGQGQVQSLKLDGQPTTLATKFSSKLEQVSQLITFGSLYTYLAVLLLEITLAVHNTTGGQITIPWQRLHDVLQGVTLTYKAADVVLWESESTGGQMIWQTFYQKFGTFPFNQTDLVIANAATETVYMQLPITFWDPDFSDDEEGGLIWAELLANSTIEFTWAASTLFGANVSYTVDPTLSAYAVPRSDRRFGTLFRHYEQAPTNFAQDNLAVNGLFPVSIVLMPYKAPGAYTMFTFDADAFQSISLTYDGTPIYQQASPTTLVALQNLMPRASADRLGQWEADGNLMLVLASPERSSGQKSNILFASKQPIVRYQGDGSTTIDDFRYLHRVIVPSGKATAKAAFAAIGINCSDDELAPKFSFNPTADPSILQTVPWAYSPKKAQAAG